MSDSTPDFASEILELCRQNAAQIADALRECLDVQELQVQAKPVTPLDTDGLPTEAEGPGLMLVAAVGDRGAALLLPEASGFLPDWIAHVDAASQDRLQAASDGLWPAVLPESLSINRSAAGRVDHLANSIAAAGPTDQAAFVTLELTVGEQVAEAALVWPLSKPGVLLDEVAPSEASDDEEAPSVVGRGRGSLTWEALPPYARHLLRIEVPVTVNLVSKKLSVQELIELSPGAMISFEKPCDAPLEMMVGNQCVALGSAVKVGECFGLEISEMTMPVEHFVPIRKVG